MVLEPQDRDRGRETQRKKYEDYSAEMSRRSKLRKTYAPGRGGFRYLKEHDPERFNKIIEDRELKRRFDRNKEE